jgi:ribosome maturation factor RimP
MRETRVLSFGHHISPAWRNGRGMRPFVLKGLNSMATGTYQRERELTAAITPTVESTLSEVEVLAVELLSPARFCVYVDHPSGVDFALCERVTHLLDAYRADWTIDVSSPGPERPLRRPEHFRRAIGGTVKLKTADARRLRGTLVAADDHAVTVSVDGTAHEIPVGEIVRGNLIDEGR